MLSATSNIELEFFRNFLNMFKSKIPISTDFAVSEGAITIALESSTKVYGIKLAQGTELQRFFLFFRVTQNTGRD